MRIFENIETIYFRNKDKDDDIFVFIRNLVDKPQLKIQMENSSNENENENWENAGTFWKLATERASVQRKVPTNIPVVLPGSSP